MKRIFTGIIVFLLIFSFTVSVYAQDDKIKEFTRDYERLMKSDSNNIDAHRNFIIKWAERNDELQSIYKKLVSDSPNNPIYQYALGYVYASSSKDEDIDNAIGYFRKSVELNPKLTVGYFSLGSMYLRKKDYKQAEVGLQKTIELDDKFYSAYYNLGEVYRNQKQDNLAILAYKKALAVNEKWGYPYYGMGMIYFVQDDLTNSEEQFSQAIKYSSEIADAHFKLGLIYAKQDMDIELVSKAYRDGQKYVSEANKNDEKQAFYDLGNVFAEKGKSGLAIQSYKNAINIDPNMASAQFALGSEYFRMGLKERAVEHLKMAIQADPAIIKSFLDEAKDQYQSEDLETAKESLDKIIAIDENNTEAHYYYAEIQARSGNPTEAIKHYEDTIRIDPNFVKAYMPLGDLYYADSKLKEAQKAYQKAIALDQSLDRYFFNAGISALELAEKPISDDNTPDSKRNNYNSAKTSFEKHLMLYPDDPEANYRLARSYEGLGDKDNAMKYYQKTSQLDPSRADIIVRIAEIYREQNKLDEALGTISKITKLGDQADISPQIKIEAYKTEAAIYENLGDLDSASKSLEELVRLDPSDTESHYKLGVFYEEKKGDLDRAMIEYEAVVKLDQTKADPFLRLGDIYVKKGAEESKIMDVYEKGLILDPNHPQIQYDLALLYKKNGNIEKAIEHYDMANELLPGNYQWHYEYAKLLENSDKGKALEEYTHTIKLKRDFTDAYYGRAMLMKKYKVIDGKVYRSEQIIEDLKQVVEFDPNRADAYYNIALLYNEQEAYDTARTYFERTVKADPSYKEAHLELGMIAESKGEFARAIEEYKKEIEVNDLSSRAHHRLGYLYGNNLNDYVKAEEQFQKSLKLDNSNVEALVNYANILYTLEKYGQSADYFEKVLQVDPKNPTANYNLGLVYERWGKNKLAIEQWKKFLAMNPPGAWGEEAKKHLKALGAK